LVYTSRGIGGKKEERLNLLRHMEVPGARGVWAAAGSLREVESEVDVVLPEGTGM
jgi:hypothetical protein